MLPNLSALGLGRQEAPTAGGLFGTKTPEEKAAKAAAKAAAEAAKTRAKVLAGFKERLVTFFLATCHWRMSGREKPEAIVPEEYGFENASKQPPPATAAEKKAQQGREARFLELNKRASYCEHNVKHFTDKKYATKTNTPSVAWDVLVTYYKDEKNKPVLESIMDAAKLMTHMRLHEIDAKGNTVADRWGRETRWWQAYNEIMEFAGWKTDKTLYTKGNLASAWADAYIRNLSSQRGV